MAHTEERLLDVLRKYASDPTARGMLRRAKEQIALDGEDIPSGQFRRLRQALDIGIRVFVDAQEREAASEDLRVLEEELSAPTTVELSIADEHEIRRARMQLRQICLEAGAPPQAAIAAARALAELVSSGDAHGSRLRIALEAGPPAVLRLTAFDPRTGEEHQGLAVVLRPAETVPASRDARSQSRA